MFSSLTFPSPISFPWASTRGYWLHTAVQTHVIQEGKGRAFQFVSSSNDSQHCAGRFGPRNTLQEMPSRSIFCYKTESLEDCHPESVVQRILLLRASHLRLPCTARLPDVFPFILQTLWVLLRSIPFTGWPWQKEPGLTQPRSPSWRRCLLALWS